MPERRRDVWLVLPTYDEAENIEAIVDGRARAAPGRRAACSSSTTPRPTAPARSPTGSPPSTPTSRSCTAPARRGSGPPTSPGSSGRSARAPGSIAQMDADFSHDPADLPRLLGAAADADLVLGSRYVAGGGVERLGRRPARDQPRRQRLRARRARGRRRATSPAASRSSAARCSRRSTSTTIESLGYAFQVETTYRAHQGRASAWSRSRSPSATGEVGESKMSQRIVLEAALRVPGMRLRGR